MINYDTLNKELDKAKVALLQPKTSAFISTILFSLKFSWDESIPTAGTDGINLKISPDFFSKLDREERVFLLAHEAWHVAFLHMSRLTKEKRDNFRMWNIACDHYINLMLINSGHKMIKGGCADEKYKDQSIWSSDKIFKDLMEDKDAQEKYSSDDSFTEDMSEGTDGMDKEQAEEYRKNVQRRIEDSLVKAQMQAKMAGQASSIPSEIAINIESFLNPKLPWNVILQRFMSDYSKEDYSFKRPNKRFASHGIILPSLYSESLGHIACAVDTSCSVSDEQFNMFRTELNSIKKKLNPKLMTIIDFDTDIRKVHKLNQSDNIDQVQFSGRGGTYMHPVFEYFTKQENTPKVLIIFSDLECEEITEDPGFPVIWIKLDGYGFNPRFGEVIDLD